MAMGEDGLFMSINMRYFLKMFKMREMPKIINIAVIFMILGCWEGQKLAYSSDISCLRVPMGIDKNRVDEILTNKDGSEGSLSGVSLERFIQFLRDFGLHSGFFDFIDTLDIKNGDMVIAIGTSTDFLPSFVLAARGARVVSIDLSENRSIGELSALDTYTEGYGYYQRSFKESGGRYIVLSPTNYKEVQISPSSQRIIMAFNVLDQIDGATLNEMIQKIFDELQEGGYFIGSVKFDHDKIAARIQKLTQRRGINIESMGLNKPLKEGYKSLLFRVTKKPPRQSDVLPAGGGIAHWQA